MRSLLRTMLVAAGAIVLSLGRANAGLIGDSVHATYLYPNFGTVFLDGGTQTIIAGTVFFPLGTTDFTITFSTSQIIITNNTAGAYPSVSFVGPDLAFLSGPAITGVTEDATSTPSFATGSVLSFGANDINVNLAGTCGSCVNGEQIILDVTTAAAVPEPANLILLGTALFGFCIFRRRKPGAKSETV